MSSDEASGSAARRPVSSIWPIVCLPGRRGVVAASAANVAAWSLVIVCYWWFATGGRDEWQNGPVSFHSLLAEAFLAHQLHLTVQPSPELLALPDPYDPAAYTPFRLADASLYDGKYYLYFGPVPALIHAAIFSAIGRFPQDSVMGLAFGLGVCFWIWLLLRELAAWLGPGSRDPTVLAVFLTCALGGVGLTCTTMVVGHCETALASAFFVTGGSLFWIRALRNERRLSTMAAAGLFFGLAACCRAPAVTYGAGAFAALLAHDLAHYGPRRLALRRSLVMAAPFAALVGLLFLYNVARFGSPFEFGMRYQLTGLDPALTTFSINQIPTGVVAMFGGLPRLIPYFPYQLDPFRSIPGTHIERPMISVLLLFPMLWFVPLGLGMARRAPHALRTYVVGTALGVLGSFVVICAYPWVTARFAEDFGPLASMLGAAGLFATVGWLRRHRYGPPIAVGLTTACTVVGLFFGVTLAFNSQPTPHPVAYLTSAYVLDTLESRLLQQVAPEFWQSTYLRGAVRERKFGIFYPEGATVPLSVHGAPVALTIVSLLPEPTDIAARINGQDPRVFTIRPNVSGQLFPVGDRLLGQQAVTVSLRITDVSDVDDGYLWPVTLGPTSDDVSDAMAELRQEVASRGRRIETGSVSRRRRQQLLDEMQALIRTGHETVASVDQLIARRAAARPAAQADLSCPDTATVEQLAAMEHEVSLPVRSTGVDLPRRADVLVRLARCRVEILRRLGR